MSFTQDFFTQRRNFDDGNIRIGELDRLWYDSNTNTIRISDGVTSGGIIVGNAASSASIPANISYFYNDIGYLTSLTGVSSISASIGISTTASTGDVGISNTGILSVTGTPNQINVFNDGVNNLTLSLPQDFNFTANVVLGNLTVTNLTVLGNTFVEIPNTIVGTRLYLGNTASSNAAINGGGIYLGNSQSGITRSITFDQTSNSWVIDGLDTGLFTHTINSANVNAQAARFSDSVHMGTAYESYDFPNATLQIDSNVNSYSQVVIQNHFRGVSSSTDYIAVNDIGDDSQHYIDFGINSSVYTDPNYSASKPNDGYLYVNQGNLVIGVDSLGKQLVFTAGGMTNGNIIATANNSGWYINTNLYASTGHLTESVNLFFTNSRARSSISVTTGNIAIGGNLNYNSNTGIITYNPVDLTSYALNANVISANVGMKGYVDSSISANISGIRSFSHIKSNGTWINAASNSDTITYLAGNNISLSSNTSTNTITITNLYGNANVKAFLNSIDIENTYLSAQDFTTQYQNANIRIANSITLSNTDFSSNINNSNGNITIVNPGIYNLQFSVQITSNSNSDQDVYIWLRQNGADVPNSSGLITLIPRQNAGVMSGAIASWNYLVNTTNSNEFVQLYWWSNGGNSVTLSTVGSTPASLTNPSIPSAPSVILTMVPVRIN